jgi:hypothetical protein
MFMGCGATFRVGGAMLRGAGAVGALPRVEGAMGPREGSGALRDMPLVEREGPGMERCCVSRVGGAASLGL